MNINYYNATIIEILQIYTVSTYIPFCEEQTLLDMRECISTTWVFCKPYVEIEKERNSRKANKPVAIDKFAMISYTILDTYNYYTIYIYTSIGGTQCTHQPYIIYIIIPNKNSQKKKL
jgi:hypothetical protein